MVLVLLSLCRDGRKINLLIGSGLDIMNPDIMRFIEKAYSIRNARIQKHSITFANIEKKGDFAETLGSGTLVVIGSHKGILTARHVIEKIEEEVKEFTIIPLHNDLRLAQCPSQLVDHTRVIYPKEYSVEAADIAFIKLTQPSVVALEAQYCVFKNLNCDVKIEKSNDKSVKTHNIIGNVGERNTFLIESNNFKYNTLIEDGDVFDYTWEGRIDVHKFCLNSQKEFSDPKSFGGMSGGGVWQCSLNISQDDIIDMRSESISFELVGVLFFQRENSSSGWDLIFHGPSLLYGNLKENVMQLINS